MLGYYRYYHIDKDLLGWGISKESMHTMKEMRMIRRWITLSFSFRFEAFDQKISLAAFVFEPESFFCALVTKAFARYLTLITRNESSSIASVFLILEGTSNESSTNNFCLASPSSLDVVMNVLATFIFLTASGKI